MAYELIVIGGGPAGYVAAIRASQLGMKTALIERRKLGGTCLNRGCVPTKAFLHTAETYRRLLEGEPGVLASGLSLDEAAMRAHKDGVVDGLRDGVGKLLAAAGVDVIVGDACVTAVGRVTVRRAPDTAETRSAPETLELEADRVLIASGSAPAKLPVSGADLDGVLTSDDLLEGAGHPFTSVTIVGGGVIGVEMALVYARFGAPVTMLEAMPAILPMMDREISQSVAMTLRKLGVDIKTGAMLREITRAADGGLTCRFETRGAEETATATHVLLATGRVPNLDCVADTLPLARNGRFLAVDEHYQTSAAGVFAVGDAIGGAMLAHAASAQGVAAVEDMAGAPRTGDPSLIPACVYTSPEIACVGLTLDDAKKRGIDAVAVKQLMSANARTLIERLDRGFIKLVFERESERLIGAQLLCARATDIINELSLAIQRGLTADEVARVTRPHPTFGEAVTEAAEAFHGRAIQAPAKRRVP